jgi:hypothetical protein
MSWMVGCSNGRRNFPSRGSRLKLSILGNMMPLQFPKTEQYIFDLVECRLAPESLRVVFKPEQFGPCYCPQGLPRQHRPVFVAI